MLHDVDAVVLVGGQGHAAAPADAVRPQADAADRGGAVPGPPALADPGRRASAASCSAPPTWPRPSPSTSATARRSAWRSSTSSRTSRWAPAAASATWPSTSRADDVLVFNGDVLCRHRPRRRRRHPPPRPTADVTLHLVRVQDPRAFGCVPTDADGRVLAFLEKTENPPTDQINAGCYVFRRAVIESIPTGRPVSVERETFPGLLPSGARVSGHVDSPTGSTSAPPPTSSAARPTWCAASRRRRRCPARPASRWSCAGAEVDRTARSCRRHDGRARRARSARARGWTARCCSTARWSAPGAVVEHVGGRGRARGSRRARRCATRWSATGRSSARTASCARGMRVWPDVVLPPHGVRFSADV